MTIEEWSKRGKVTGFKDRERQLQAKECGRSLELKTARKALFPHRLQKAAQACQCPDFSLEGRI